jgi:hypothetical protein
MTSDLQERCSAAKAQVAARRPMTLQPLADAPSVLVEFVALCIICLIEALQTGVPVIRFDARHRVGLVAADGYELTFCARDIRDPAAENKAWQGIAFQRGKVRVGQLRAYALQRAG